MSDNTETQDPFEITVGGLLFGLLMPLGFTVVCLVILWLINGRSFQLWQLSAEKSFRLATFNKSRPKITLETNSELHIDSQLSLFYLWLMISGFPITGIICMFIGRTTNMWLAFPITMMAAAVQWALICGRGENYRLRRFGSHMVTVDRHFTLMGITVKKMENIQVKGCELVDKSERRKRGYDVLGSGVHGLVLHVNHETKCWELGRSTKESLEPAYKALVQFVGEYKNTTTSGHDEALV